MLYLVVAIIGLVSTQSKTSWIACLVSASYFVGATRRERYTVLGKMLLGVCVAGAVGAIGWYVIADWVKDNTNSIVTLTGRRDVWGVLWDIGRKDPWFGSGAGWQSVLQHAAPLEYKMTVGNAHNQLLDSFLTTGLAGIVCWSLYVVALIRGARGVCGPARSLYIGILLVILTECFVETLLEPGGYSLTEQLQTILVGFGFCRTYSSVAASTRCRRPWARAQGRAALALTSPSVWRRAI